MQKLLALHILVAEDFRWISHKKECLQKYCELELNRYYYTGVSGPSIFTFLFFLIQVSVELGRTFVVFYILKNRLYGGMVQKKKTALCSVLYFGSTVIHVDNSIYLSQYFHWDQALFLVSLLPEAMLSVCQRWWVRSGSLFL